jgi:phosphoglycerol geranylgeranyltransferase
MKASLFLTHLQQRQQQGFKSLAVLLDPDNLTEDQCDDLITNSLLYKVDYFFVGGSLITSDNFHLIIRKLKSQHSIPVIIFPGSNLHIDFDADAILLLSLISGRNADMLIGQHVIAAPILKKSKLEVIPTGYMLIDSGAQTSVSYISNTTPIPYDKTTIAACTAMAGELLGLRMIYMDAGSGALKPISTKMISSVRKAVDIPLIVGGGITSAATALESLKAGADVVVIGNGIEKNPGLLPEVSEKIKEFNLTLDIH